MVVIILFLQPFLFISTNKKNTNKVGYIKIYLLALGFGLPVFLAFSLRTYRHIAINPQLF